MAYRQRAIPVAAVKNRKKSDAKGAKNDNMKKRLQRIGSCVLLCALLLAAALPAPVSAASTGFSDVPDTHWAADDIHRAVDLGLFQGQTKTRFGLGQPMTRAAAAVQKLASRVNLYVEESAPWNLAKSEETAGELAEVIYNALEAIRIIALYMAPLMPNTSAEVFRRLSLGSVTDVTDIEAATAWGQLPAGNAVEIGDPLFPRLDTDAIDLSME